MNNKVPPKSILSNFGEALHRFFDILQKISYILISVH